MDTTLISLETAKLAKEKLFDLEVPSYYVHPDVTDSRKKEYLVDGRNSKYKKKETKNYNKWGCWPWRYYSCPEQIILQEWLKNVHNIYVIMYTNQSGYFYEIKDEHGNYLKEFNWDGPDYRGFWSNYHKSLENGLCNAIKLIKK